MEFMRPVKRFLCMRRHRSSVPTGLVPISDIRTAVVFLNRHTDITEPDKVVITRFFEQNGVSWTFISPENEDIRTQSDLFMSLSPVESVHERYAATSSTARFKIGRHQIKGGIFDFVVIDNTVEPRPELDAFRVMRSFIVSIQ